MGQDEGPGFDFLSIYSKSTAKQFTTTNVSRPAIKPSNEMELRHEDIYSNNEDIVDQIIYQKCPLYYYDATPFFDRTYDEKNGLAETKNPLRKDDNAALGA